MTVVEILQSIKQADMSPMLGRIYGSPGGVETLDALMKYLYVISSFSKPALNEWPKHVVLFLLMN